MTEKSDAECEEALQSFVQITGTDEACAHFFLQDVDWDVQAAVDAFFETTGSISDSKNGLSKPIPEEPTQRTSQTRSLASTCTFLSWNVDGLDTANLKSRFTAICYILSKISPDIVFLQELSPPLAKDLRENLGGEYSILLASPNQQYFTGILLKPTIDFVTHSCFPFAQTSMGRSMEIAYIGEKKLRLLNTHLESGAEFAESRMAQLQECFQQLRNWDDGETFIIFGGDLNLRDKEVKNVPEGFEDAWVACGSKPNLRYTWDMQKNDNKSIPGVVRCRFDRVFYKCNGAFSSVDFALEGQNRLRSSLCFPSDHWAVVVTFY